MNSSTKTPLLDMVDDPAALRSFSRVQLRQLADELRQETVDVVSVTGGHLGAGLGVIELTVALHKVFDTPRDRLIWDVGHQSYPHKILTGRRSRMRTLRQGGGISGFTKRGESVYDPFGAAHSSTSISAGLGFAVARDLKGANNNVIAVIGDGAMSAGMAYEAMNNAGARGEKLIVILNDNDMSIAPPVGAMSAYLDAVYKDAPSDSPVLVAALLLTALTAGVVHGTLRRADAAAAAYGATAPVVVATADIPVGAPVDASVAEVRALPRALVPDGALDALPDGRRVLIAGTKDGDVFALDPDNRGKLMWRVAANTGGGRGGCREEVAASGHSKRLAPGHGVRNCTRSEEHTSELQSH